MDSPGDLLGPCKQVFKRIMISQSLYTLGTQKQSSLIPTLGQCPFPQHKGQNSEAQVKRIAHLWYHQSQSLTQELRKTWTWGHSILLSPPQSRVSGSMLMDGPLGMGCIKLGAVPQWLRMESWLLVSCETYTFIQSFLHSTILGSAQLHMPCQAGC